MPKFTNYTAAGLDRTLREIEKTIYTRVAELNLVAWRTVEPVPFSERRSGEKMNPKVGDKWGDLFDCAWFHFTGRVPASAAGKKIVLLIDVNGELCVVDKQGIPTRGLTSGASVFNKKYGEPRKRVLQISERAKADQRIDIWADAGCNDLFGNLTRNGTIAEADIAVCRDDARALYYDFEVLLDLFKTLPEDTARRARVGLALNDASHCLRDFSATEIRDARRALAPALAQRGGDPSLSLSAAGHAHMDLAWLWPARETIRKGARTFATALDLMKRYPDYIYSASQPQLYDWMKDHYPTLYGRIKRQVAAGRIEPEGAMWVESDCNLPGGESLVRQFLYGKKFFQDEFGVDSRILWIPDVFGYTAALPQIMKQCGVDYFMTQKLSWNQINVFPHHSLHWRGIDGSTVLAHMLPEDNYLSAALPSSVRFTETQYKDKDVSDRCLMLFGIGDGGGGPGAEHLERLSRLKNLDGVAPVRQEKAIDFFSEWEKDAARFATWSGELYLERHQGTFTTQARTKRHNRLMQEALREWEWTAALAEILTGAKYPASNIEKTWKEVLLYQFHDILPGSSIKRVYDECDERYEILLSEANDNIARNDGRLARQVDTSGMKKPVLVWNSLSHDRREWVRIDGRWKLLEAPSMGYKAVDLDDAIDLDDAAESENASSAARQTLAASETLLENDLLRVRFDRRSGAIAAIRDKRTNRELVAAGALANRLAVYKDDGDAWDIPLDYADRPPRYMNLTSAKFRIDGPRAVLTQVYRIGHSEITQEIALTAGSPRIDFRTRARWRETASMLRAIFPLSIRAEEATYEIQFGQVRRPTRRNTTWDLAMDEVPAQRWVDLSEKDFGVALLNDCKHGHKIKDNTIELNLIRNVPYPNAQLVAGKDVEPPEASRDYYTDHCDHDFAYALYPHAGDAARTGEATRVAAEFNAPLRTVSVRASKGDLPPEASFLRIERAPTVFIEHVKIAERAGAASKASPALVVRLYESAGARTSAKLRIGIPFRSIEENNLLEQNPRPLKRNKTGVNLRFKPFEIKTIRIALSIFIG